MDAEIGGKRLQLLRELIPNLGCFAVLATTATTARFSVPFVEDLRSAAGTAGIRIEPILIGGPSEFRTAFAAMAKGRSTGGDRPGFLRPTPGDPDRTRG
jgi:putative ABC transport system substrate-binding protein